MSTENVDRMIQRAQILRADRIDQAMNMLDEALAIAQKFDYRRGMALIIRDRAICHLQQHDFKRALSGFAEALVFFKQLNDKTAEIACRTEISAIHVQLGDCPSAMEHILENLKSHMAAGDNEGVAECYTEIAGLYLYLQHYEKAIDYFKMALKIFEGLKIRRKIINCYYQLGNAFQSLNDDDHCLFYFLRASHSLEEARDVDVRTKTLCGLAKLYTRQKDFQKAMDTFQHALKTAETGASLLVKVQLKKNLGHLYLELNQVTKSIEILNDALRMAAVLPVDNSIVRLHQLLATAYEKAGNLSEALRFHKSFHEMDKQVASEALHIKTKALHFKFDLEELQKQKDIAELSGKLKEQFLANVSHEIRTPMNGILGMTHLLDKSALNKEQREYVGAIKTSADNLMSVINDILDFSTINAGKIEFSKSEFSLREVIKGVVQTLKLKADEKHLQLTISIDYNLNDRLQGDAIRLSQILTNLVSNAIKFTEKGKIHIEVKLLESSGEECRLRFRVTDTGIGIAEDQLQRIFNSFEQGATREKRRAAGTGLGLTIVKQLVELQGGTINVQSRPGNGSAFTFELPFGRPETKKVEKPNTTGEQHDQRDLSHLRILVVEDNKVNQLLVKNILRKFGITQPDTAENGKDALRKLEQYAYDLVLMDIQMPEMDGYETTRLLRQRLTAEKKNVPVIALTADASEEEKNKAAEAGMNDYIVKPYTPEELYNTIKRHAAPPAEVSDDELAMTVKRKRSLSGIKLDVLESFTDGDRELTIQVMEIFLRQVPEAIRKIDEALQHDNWQDVFSHAHKIKSSLSVFGLNELRSLMLQIEENAREKRDPEGTLRLFREFTRKSEPVVESISNELERIRNVGV